MTVRTGTVSHTLSFFKTPIPTTPPTVCERSECVCVCVILAVCGYERGGVRHQHCMSSLAVALRRVMLRRARATNQKMLKLAFYE